MDVFVNFLKTYYKEIVEILVLIISVVICLIRKRPCINEIDTIKKDVLNLLPALISQVERVGAGSEKKNEVMSLVFAYVKRKYSFTPTSDFISFVSGSIENILSTPQRKGK